jgi:hypothetical protein
LTAQLRAFVARGQFDEAEALAHTAPGVGGFLFLAELARSAPTCPGGGGGGGSTVKLKTVVHHAKRFAARAAQDVTAHAEVSSSLATALLLPLLRERRWDVCAALSTALGMALPEIPLLCPPLWVAVSALDAAARHRTTRGRGAEAAGGAGGGAGAGGGDEEEEGEGDGEEEHAVRAMIARDATLRVSATMGIGKLLLLLVQSPQP